MNILIISQYFWPENFRINDLAVELSNRGHNITVLTGYPNYPEGIIFSEFKNEPKKFETLKGINIIRVPIIPRGNKKFTLFLNYLSYLICSCFLGLIKLRGISFDKILVYQVSPITVGLTAILVSKVKKAPIYFWVLDQWPETLISMGVIRSRITIYFFSCLSNYIYKNCTAILGQSESFLKNIEKKYDVSKNKLYYFPNWAEEIFTSMTSDNCAPEILKGKNDFVILFAGNVGEAQGFDSVIEAARITKNQKNIKWVVIGKGRDWSRIKQKIKNLKLSSVEMLGQFPLERMREFYGSADAMLICLKSDPLFSLTVPGKLQTYFMARKPILGMIDGEAKNLIDIAKAGFSTAAEDHIGLARNALNMANLSKLERDKMGQNGREYCIRNFNRKKIIDSLETLILS
jgi:glycosyltransferase involved in cell wall biosynthesis